MQEPSKRDAHLNHGFGFLEGTLSQEILREKKSRPEKYPDVQTLSDSFARLDCPNVAECILYLATPEGSKLEVFGSGTIMPEGTSTQTPLTPEIAISLGELYIGSKREGITPLEWLGYFGRFAENVPPEVRKVVDTLCQIIVGPATGKFETTPVTAEDLDGL